MKPIRITITAIVFTLFHWAATAQPINKTINDVVMPAPNAASLGKYGDIPVSYFTGVPNISIPIYTVQEGSLSLPISLSYHASGVKINENASWVGLNWSLNAGGVVSRTVLGLPDEINTGYFDYGNTLVAPMIPNDLTSTQQMEAVAVGSRDAEPDLFNFNVGGYSGKFVFDKDKNVHLIPKSDLKVEYVRVTGTGNPSNTYFIRFIITTPDGTRYIFGSLEGEANNAYSGIEFNYYDNIQTNSIAPSSWYLRRIESPDRHYQITIDYQSETYNYRSLGSCSFFYDSYSGGPSGSCGPVSISPYVSVTNNSIQGKRLWRIVSSTTTVNFIANTNREDIPLQKRLDAIEIMHPGNANYCSRFDLTYDYMLSPNATAPIEEYKRLRLLELQEKSCDNSIVNPAYKFSYIAGNLPHRISRATDHWGFHNGATQNETTFGIPPVSATLGSQTIAPPYANAYRETSESNMQIGTLNKVEYPTGGYTQLTYEANDYLTFQNVSSEQISVGPLSNCTYPQAACCTNTQTVTTYTFNATQLNQAKFRLILTNLNIGPYQYCNIGNPNPPSPSVNITVKQTSNNVVVGSYGFNLTNTQSSNTITQLLTTLANLSASVSYTFTLTVQHGKGEFYIFTEGSTSVAVNKKVGGLRVKEIRIHDGISTGNDIVKQYKYIENTSSTNSSGKLYFKPEYFGYSYNVFSQPVAVTFFSYSSVPMTSFEGYHVSYRRVSEETVGGGKTVYLFNQELNTQDYQETYPFSPYQAKVKDGQEEKVEVYNSSNTKLQETTTGFYADAYITLPGNIYKAFSIDLGTGPGGQPRNYLYAKPYPIRTAPFRHASKQETRDGVVTTTTFQYDTQNRHYAPTAILLTNSDGKNTTTRNKYVFDWPSSTLRTEMINRNMIGSPVETTTEVNGLTVSGSRTDYSFFNSTGFPTATATGNHPYPYQFYSYEMTWVNGVATTGAWVLKGTTNEYQSTSNAGKGYPRKFTQAGWLAETYTWQNGLITNRTYSGFSWNYTYHTGTRLVASILDIDGQTSTFAYDKLRRLQTASARGGNVVTTNQYQFRNAQNPNNFVRSTTNFTAVSGSSLTQRESVQYLDGLGRPIQDVKTKHRPAKGANDQSNTISDVVVNHTYDNQGRLIKTTLPYLSPYNTGAYYAPPAGTLFTQTTYENSPLNRVSSVTAPNGYATTTTYGTNAAAVTIPGTSTSFAANTLYVTTQTDPDNRVSITYADKKGRVVMTRQTNTANTSPADTYTEYTDKDQPSRIIPPGATAANAELVFTYEYTAAGLPSKKKVPGAALVEMRYNTRDLLASSCATATKAR